MIVLVNRTWSLSLSDCSISKVITCKAWLVDILQEMHLEREEGVEDGDDDDELEVEMGILLKLPLAQP